MKIAFLSFYSGHTDRGVEVAVEALATRVAKSHEVTVFQAGDRNILKDSGFDPGRGFTLIQLPVERYWPEDSSYKKLRLFYLDYYSRKIAWFTLKFLPFFFKNKYDLVIPTNGGLQTVIVRLVTWITGKKMVVQGNAGIGRDDLWQLCMYPNLFIAISPAGYIWSKSKCPWVKKVYIPYGVDTVAMGLAKPAEIQLPRPLILCVSAFMPYKRINLLLEAVNKLNRGSLLLIGQGPLEQELREFGEQLLGKERFRMLTNVNHRELFAYYKSADVFSLPSEESEAFGIVYIEAMAAGLPVIAPTDKNRQELIGEAGILVDPTDIDQYAQALEKALNTDFGDKPRKQAEKFSWDKIVREYDDVLSK